MICHHVLSHILKCNFIDTLVENDTQLDTYDDTLFENDIQLNTHDDILFKYDIQFDTKN